MKTNACLSLLIAIIITSAPLFTCPGEPEKAPEGKKVTTVAGSIAEINLQTFPREEDEPFSTHSYTEFMDYAFKQRTQPSAKKRRENAFKLVEAYERTLTPPPTINDTAIWNDVTLFVGQKDKQRFVANAIDRTKTELGKVALYRLLSEPIEDQKRLLKRQQVIRTLLSNAQVLTPIQQSLADLARTEHIMLGFWGYDHFSSEAKRGTFGIERVDNLAAMLELKQIYDRGTHAWFFITDVLATATLLGYGLSQLTGYHSQYIDSNIEKSAGWTFDPLLKLSQDHRFICATLSLFIGGLGAFYLQGHFDWVRGNFRFDDYLQKIMIDAATYIRGLAALHKVISTNPELASFDEFKALQELFEKQTKDSSKLYELIQSLNSWTFEGEASLLSYKGRVLRAYLLANEIKADFQAAIVAAGTVDAYASTATLINEYAGKNVKFCFPTYVASAVAPSIQLSNFWHPILPADKAVANSVTLGTDGQRPNLVITGPNEGGKSTVLKAITLCLLFAQTLGIAPAEAMTFTPFHSIATYLNLTDDIGAGNSLFKAEVLRAQQLIDRIEKAPRNEFYFAVFDEMFNGTTPVEASAASYSVARHMASFSNSICLFATHFSIMTTLEQDSDRMANYHVHVNLQDNGNITYPYKLTRGVGSQHVAIPILRKQGFAQSVLDDAQAVATRIAPSFDAQG